MPSPADSPHLPTSGLSPADRGCLRREVGALRLRESRRVFDSMVYVGQVGGPRDSFVARAQDLPALDAALKVDVVSALVETMPAHQCGHAWTARAGWPETSDADLAWLAAATVAFGMHGRELEGFFAITRSGWLDVRTGEHRVWKRLRL